MTADGRHILAHGMHVAGDGDRGVLEDPAHDDGIADGQRHGAEDRNEADGFADLLLPRSSVHLPNAPMGPAPVARPSANSPMTPVEPMRMTQMKYGMRNVMPPQMETMMGKRQMLPMPTAEPMQARIKPHWI